MYRREYPGTGGVIGAGARRIIWYRYMKEYLLQVQEGISGAWTEEQCGAGTRGSIWFMYRKEYL